MLRNNPDKLRPLVFRWTIDVFEIFTKMHGYYEGFSELPIEFAYHREKRVMRRRPNIRGKEFTFCVGVVRPVESAIISFNRKVSTLYGYKVHRMTVRLQDFCKSNVMKERTTWVWHILCEEGDLHLLSIVVSSERNSCKGDALDLRRAPRTVQSC